MTNSEQRESRRNKLKLKKNVSVEETRSSRQEVTIQIRKEKKDKRVMARRMNGTTNVTASNTNAPSTAEIDATLSRCKFVFHQWRSDDMSQLEQIFEAVKQIRMLLTSDIPGICPYQQVLSSGCLPFLLKALRCSDLPKLQFESAWALTNITASPDKHVVAQVAYFPDLISELSRFSLEGRTPKLRLQCAWCLGNLAEDEPRYRDIILSIECTKLGFVHNMNKPETEALLAYFVWALRNIVKNSATRDVMDTKCFVPVVLRKLKASTIESEQLRVDLCFCLCHLAECDVVDHNARAQVLLDFNGLPILMEVLRQELEPKHPCPNVLVPLTRCLGMFAAGSAEQTDALVEAGFLGFVPALMKLQSPALLKETLWALSNIAGGTPDQIALLVENTRILKDVVDASQHDNWLARREGLWTLCNLLSSGNTNVPRKLLGVGIVFPFCASIEIPEADLLCSILDGFTVLLAYDATKPNGSLPLSMDEEGAIDKLEHLLQHRSDEVYKRALKIIEDNFAEPDMLDEDQNMCPQRDANNSFTFGHDDSAKQLFPENNSHQVNFERTNFGQMSS
ncbi:hypothetical protein ACA910_015779 [Epithemia clementina (nom. ined.)]